MKALIYHSNHHRRFAAALCAAALIHLAAVGFANTRQEAPPIVSGPTGGREIELMPTDPTPQPQADQPDPLPTPPPTTDQFIPEQDSTPPPVRRQTSKFVAPLVKSRSAGSTGSMTISSAKVFAITAPRPEYPYEARRQKITGDGVVAMTVDLVSGQVTDVSIVKSTGNPFLDNAAISGFRRWRFKPGTMNGQPVDVIFSLTVNFKLDQ